MVCVLCIRYIIGDSFRRFVFFNGINNIRFISPTPPYWTIQKVFFLLFVCATLLTRVNRHLILAKILTVWIFNTPSCLYSMISFQILLHNPFHKNLRSVLRTFKIKTFVNHNLFSRHHWPMWISRTPFFIRISRHI